MRFHIRNFKFRYQIWTLFLVIFLILSLGSGGGHFIPFLQKMFQIILKRVRKTA